MKTVATNTIALINPTNCGCSIIISGPGRMQWMKSAAISTTELADPGTASVIAGMSEPGTTAELPVSAAIRPS